MHMQNERGLVRRSAKREDGMTLVEVLISTLVLTVGLVAVAGLLAVTTTAQIGARESARSVRLAQEKIDELVKLPFSDAQVAVGGSLDENSANHNEAGDDGITIRWLVAEGPTLNGDTRFVTVRVINLRGQHQRQTEVTSMIRE